MYVFKPFSMCHGNSLVSFVYQLREYNGFIYQECLSSLSLTQEGYFAKEYDMRLQLNAFGQNIVNRT